MDSRTMQIGAYPSYGVGGRAYAIYPAAPAQLGPRSIPASGYAGNSGSPSTQSTASGALTRR